MFKLTELTKFYDDIYRISIIVQNGKMFRIEQWIYWYMQTKYELASGFKGVEPFILDIKDQFQKIEGVIHQARNVLKKMEYDNLDLVVKSFAVPNYLNQVVYAFIRDSKAKRSFQYSMRLKEFNIITPQPVGYIEYFKQGVLKESFYVSARYDYNYTMKEVLSEHWDNKATILKKFADFTFQLHKLGVLHMDYSPGNILIKETSGSFEFCIVDVNRMRFSSVGFQTGINGFVRLINDEESLSIFSETYAKCMGCDPLKAKNLLRSMKSAYERKHKYFKKLKNTLR